MTKPAMSSPSEPIVRVPLPVVLTERATLSFSMRDMNLAQAALQMLMEDGKDRTTRLEDIQPPVFNATDPYFSIKFRCELQQRVARNKVLCERYRRLIEEVIAPHMFSTLSEDERKQLSTFDERSGKYQFEVMYQFPPTMRIHPGGSDHFKVKHRDLEYGHQKGEINFWLPLTDTSAPDAPTLEIESAISEDGNTFPYYPLRLKIGEIARFHGTLLWHKVASNLTSRTRVSLDFRVAPSFCWDRKWKIPGKNLRIIHEMRSFVLEW